MRRRLALLGSVLVLLTGCHHAVVSTGVGVYGGDVATSVAIHADSDVDGLVALSLIGAMVGSAVYADTHAYRYQGLSAIDVNIRPKDAQISLDGVVVGNADQYDGYPGFLVVNPGTHTIRARKAGYKPYEVTVQLSPGQQVNLNKQMEIAPAGTEPDGTMDRPATRPGPVNAAGVYRLVLELANPEASVYVDGTFLGTGREINQLHAPLELESSAATLTVVTDASRRQFRLDELQPGPDGIIRLHIDN